MICISWRRMCGFNRSFERVVTWQFSCSLEPSCCRFRLSSKDGNITASLGKQTDLFNRGPSALPLRLITDEELTPFRSPTEIKQFLDTSKLAEAQFLSSQDVEIRCQANTNNSTVTDPFFCLRETTYGIWQSTYKCPVVCDCSYWSLFIDTRTIRTCSLHKNSAHIGRLGFQKLLTVTIRVLCWLLSCYCCSHLRNALFLCSIVLKLVLLRLLLCDLWYNWWSRVYIIFTTTKGYLITQCLSICSQDWGSGW